jgi:hypothetical protein
MWLTDTADAGDEAEDMDVKMSERSGGLEAYNATHLPRAVSD